MIEFGCVLCGQKLAPLEATLCSTCLTFIEFKYGSLESFDHAHSKDETGGTNE